MTTIRKFEVKSKELSLYSICTWLQMIFRKVNKTIKFIPPRPYTNVALLPNAGHGLLILRFLDHTQRCTTVGRLPWMSDQPDAETSTGQHWTLTIDIHAAGGIRAHNLDRRAAARPTPWTARLLGSTFLWLGIIVTGIQAFLLLFEELVWVKCFNPLNTELNPICQ